MRIIGGKLKGKSIVLPQDYKARPTTDFAKEGLFNILNNEYEFDGLAVLDLFGGTGAISYEFASRGAGEVYCVEMAVANANFIKSQVRVLSLEGTVNVVRHNVFDFLGICTKKFDIVFADPPYSLAGLDALPDRVLSSDIIVPEGYFILEHPDTYDFTGHEHFVKEKKYGNVHFSFFSK